MLNLSTFWVYVNKLIIKLLTNTEFKITGIEELKINGKYLVVANHQSWADIVILQSIFHKKIQFLRFFLKKQLIWLPFIGLSCWVMDFPFMRRNSKNKTADLQTTRNFCKKFLTQPVAMLNFVESTRFTPKKHLKQKSPYSNLLKPRAGGLAYTLDAMRQQFDYLLDVTIIYPPNSNSLYKFMTNQIKEITIVITKIPMESIPDGNYFDNKQDRKVFKDWLNQLWHDKDLIISSNSN